MDKKHGDTMWSKPFALPFEELKAASKERVKAVGTGLDEFMQAVAAQSAEGQPPGSDFGLTELEEKLQRLKRKVEHGAQEEAAAVQRCRARIAHIEETTRESTTQKPRPKQVDRLVVDHMLRNGHHEAAAELAQETGTSDLVDLNVHRAAREIEEDLRARSCAKALAWCEQHRSKLKKHGSTLEFHLRLQQFVELARAGKQLDAIAFARANLSAWAASHLQARAAGKHPPINYTAKSLPLPEVQQVMALLAFKPGKAGSRYKAVLSDERWTDLIREFRENNFRLHGLPVQSLLAHYLQAGAAALNTPRNDPDTAGYNPDDPLCQPEFLALARGLPFSKHIHSSWVCPITKALMDEDNPPVVLPNGFVYSRAAMVEMAARSGGGRIECTRTGDGPFELGQLQKVFLA